MISIGSDTLSHPRGIDLQEEFKKGLLFFLEREISLAQATRQMLRENTLNQSDRVALIGRIEKLDRCLGLVEAKGLVLIEGLTHQNLRRTATKDFYAVFDGDLSESKIGFVELMHVGLQCRAFSQTLRENWLDVQSICMALPRDSSLRPQLVARSGMGLSAADAALQLSQKIYRWLGANPDAEDLVSLVKQARYDSRRTYGFSVVISSEVEDLPDKPFRTESPLQDQRKADVRVESGKPINKDPVQNFITFKAGGMLGWNSTEAYTLTYRPKLLNSEIISFQRVLLIETHLAEINGDMRRRLIFNIIRNAPEANAENTYTRFLWKLFDAVLEIQCLLFGISSARRRLFSFHLGPKTFYFLIRKFLDKVDTGRVHSRMPGGQKYRRLLPTQLIRKTLVEWWGKNVLKDLGPERDDPNLCYQVLTNALAARRLRWFATPMQDVSVQRILALRSSLPK